MSVVTAFLGQLHRSMKDLYTRPFLDAIWSHEYPRAEPCNGVSAGGVVSSGAESDADDSKEHRVHGQRKRHPWRYGSHLVQIMHYVQLGVLTVIEAELSECSCEELSRLHISGAHAPIPCASISHDQAALVPPQPNSQPVLP